MSTFAKMKKAFADKHLIDYPPSFWRDAVGTGYFATYIGVPNARSSLVHLTHDTKPICGSKVEADMMYVFNSAGVHMPYVECEHCKRIYNKENPNV